MCLLVHYLLPWAHDIRIGTKQDGPPRWTAWLESWYTAYDPLVWEMLELDDKEDERVKTELREIGLQLLQQDAPLAVVAPFEDLHLKLLGRCLIRRERLYLLHLIRQQFLDYHLPPDVESTPASVAAVLQLAEPGDDHLFCPYAPGSIWPVNSPRPYDCGRSYAQHFFRRGKSTLNKRLTVPDTPSPESARLRYQYWASLHLLVRVEDAIEPPPPTYEVSEAAQHPPAKERHWSLRLFSRKKGRQVAVMPLQSEHSAGKNSSSPSPPAPVPLLLERFPVGI